jgi:2'-5' RNA ligase
VARLFVAVWPPDGLIEQVRALDRPRRAGLRWTTEDQWHVTLRFFGRVDAAGETALRAGLAATATASAVAEVAAGPAPRALGRGVWVLPVQGLETLAAAVAVATAVAGRPPPARPFRGHITLARARHPKALSGLTRSPVAARWSVTEITLVRSDLQPEGARYEVLDRWSLPGR